VLDLLEVLCILDGRWDPEMNCAVYEVKWWKQEETTWEPVDSFCGEEILAYGLSRCDDADHRCAACAKQIIGAQ
jgi:hypothetical protein